MKLILPLAALAAALWAENKVAVTVMDPKTAKAATGLKAPDFVLYEAKEPRKILGAEYVTDMVDVMLLLDTGLAGEMVRPLASEIIQLLGPKEQMAIIAYHSSADLIQDFTSSKELLGRALGTVRYGNEPQALNAIYAAIDGGFKNAIYRRVALLLTTGFEGRSRVSDKDVIRLARKNAVSIYPVYVIGRERSLFDTLARQTGGAAFNLQELRKGASRNLGREIFEVVRSRYVLTLFGNLALGEKVKAEVPAQKKWFVSAMPLDEL